MAKNNFLLVNLGEDKTKKLSKVIGNKTSKKILDLLTEKDYTESELSKKLGLAISTVHYNVQALVEAGLVNAEKFHYSAKGKEVLHYSLANKYIIIAPKPVYGIKEKLSSILPAGIITLGLGAVWTFFNSFARFGSATGSAEVMRAPVEKVTEDASFGVTPEAADMAAAEPAIEAVGSSTVPDFMVYFLAGMLIFVLIYLILEWVKYLRRK